MIIKITIFFILFHLIPGAVFYLSTRYSNFEKFILSGVSGIFISLFFFQLIFFFHLSIQWVNIIPISSIFYLYLNRKNYLNFGFKNNDWNTPILALLAIGLYLAFGQSLLSIQQDDIRVIGRAKDSIFTLLCSTSWNFGDKLLFKGYHYYDSLLFHIFNDFTGLNLIQTTNLYFIFFNIFSPVILYIVLKRITKNHVAIALALTLFLFDIGIYHIFNSENHKYGNTGFIAHLHNIPILFARGFIFIIIERFLNYMKWDSTLSKISLALCISISLKVKINLFLIIFGVLSIYGLLLYLNKKPYKQTLHVWGLTLLLSSFNLFLLFTDHISKTAQIRPLYFRTNHQNIFISLGLIVLSFSSYWILILKKPDLKKEFQTALLSMSVIGIAIGYLFIEEERPFHGNFLWFRVISFYLFPILLAYYYSSLKRLIKIATVIIIAITGYLGFVEYYCYSDKLSSTLSKEDFVDNMYFLDNQTSRRNYLKDTNRSKVKALLFENR